MSTTYTDEPTPAYASRPVLDHGYVRLIETWGRGDAGVPEAGIVEAARQSTQGSFRGWAPGVDSEGQKHPGDARLLAYLFNSKPQHSTPFEFAGMVIEVQAPIFVFREWDRHRAQRYVDIEGINEMSARYAPLPDVGYIPTVERICIDHGNTNKQAGTIRGAPKVSRAFAEIWRQRCIEDYARFEERYQTALTEGVPKEVARIGMPVGRYSRMRRTTSLRNWLHFASLRSDPGAQWEIQQYSNAVVSILTEQFPQTMALFRPDAP